MEEIELRENQIREQLLNSGHINKRFKKDLIDFLDKAKKWLIDAKCEKVNNTPSSIPKDYQLDKINNPIYLAPTLSKKILYKDLLHNLCILKKASFYLVN